MTVAELMRKIKSDYGMNQTALARELGISPQILTDIKAGRRIFTPPMAEKIMALFSREAGAGWLAAALEGILKGGARPGKNAEVQAPSRSSDLANGKYLPVLDALCKGDPAKATGKTRHTILIPEVLAKLVGGSTDAYVLALDNDDYSGRLRAGDQVLIVQNAEFSKEIMVVESDGRLRLARNPIDNTSAEIQWVALDTGNPLKNATPVGAVVGIVVALL